MQETTRTLLGKTSGLLDALMPVMKRSIDALKRDPNPLVQHLIAQEIKHQEGLLQQMEKIKEGLHNCLNPPDKVVQPTQSQYLDLHSDLHDDEITKESVLADGAPPAGVAALTPYPLIVTIPGRKSPIRERYGIDTLIEVIKELGIEEVRKLGLTVGPIPLVAIKRYDDCDQKEAEGYYIATKTTTFIKARQIYMMGDRLGRTPYVENKTLPPGWEPRF